MAFTTKLHAQPQGQFFGVGCFWPSCVELNHTYSLVIVCHGSSRPLTGQTVFFFPSFPTNYKIPNIYDFICGCKVFSLYMKDLYVFLK